jgi:hypothetical protein
MAKFLPTTAMLPLLRYRNGRPSLRPLTRLAMTRPTNRPCLRHSGDGVTILGHRGCISHYKDVGRLGEVHKSANDCAPSAVRCRPQHCYDRRGANARCPKHGGAGNPDASRDDTLVVNLLDLYTGRNFNAELR